jgi:hypothetical protein
MAERAERLLEEGGLVTGRRPYDYGSAETCQIGTMKRKKMGQQRALESDQLDVPVASATEASQCSSWEASFRESDWFRRGWTLQELVAPVSVEFFSREGRRIGDKASLDGRLHDITSIPLTALRNSPLDQFSPSERMRWAEKCTTAEAGDIVYCLPGLLGVFMPVTYGEGLESARVRLQVEIEADGSAPSIIPFSRNKSFVGRKSQLAQLEASILKYSFVLCY